MADVAVYDFFRKVVLQPDNITLEADSTTDELTITRGAGVAFNPNATNDSFSIDVDYQLYVPVGTTNIRLQDVNSTFSGVALTPGSNISIVRGSDSELIITATVGAASKSITNATRAVPVVVTTTNAHDFTEGTEVTITDVVGMTQLNGNEYYMDILTSTTFALYEDDLLTIPVDGTGFTAYSTGGVATADYSTQKTLASLSDTDVTGIQTNDLLAYQAGTWQPTSNIQVDVTGNVTGNLDGIVGGTTPAAGTFTELRTTETSIVLGANTGNNNQGTEVIAIGNNAGYENQGDNAIAIGDSAGRTDQDVLGIAIGGSAGNSGQGNAAIAIGAQAGNSNQSGQNAIAIGTQAGWFSQSGDNSIAIGYRAGFGNQHENTIIINASGGALNSAGTDRLYVAPIRQTEGPLFLKYDSTSMEVTASDTLGVPTGIIETDENTISLDSLGGRVPKLEKDPAKSGLVKFLANVVAGQTTVASYPNANSFFNLLNDNSFITYLDFNNDAAIDANDETVLGQVIPWVNGNQSGTNPGSFAINTYGFIEDAIEAQPALYIDEYIEDSGVKYYFCQAGASFSNQSTDGPAYFDKDIYLNNTAIRHLNEIVYEGAVYNDFETVLNAEEPTADATVTIPNDSGTIQLQEKTIALNGFAPVVDFDITGDGSVFASDSLKYSQFGNGTQMSETAFLSADSLSAKWAPITGTFYTHNKAGMRLVRGNASDALKASVGDPALGHGDTFILGNIDDPGTTVKLVTGFAVQGNEITLVNNSPDSGTIDIRQYAESGELNISNGPLFGGNGTSIEMTSTAITISGSTIFNNGLSGNLTGNVVGDVQGTVVGDDSTILVDGVNSFLNFVNNDTDDLNEGANNLYYTDARAQSATTGRSIAMSLIFGG
jgi:hypothetical protein